MTKKSKDISAGPAANDDFYLTTEGALATGPLFLDVLGNDKKKSDLVSLDDGDIDDLLEPDSILCPERSRLGASIWITADGRVGYAMDEAQAQSLAAGEIVHDSFLYAARRPNGALVWSTVHMVVIGANDAPVALADVAEVPEGALSTGSVAANDFDVDHGAVLRFALDGAVPDGFALASDGSWAFDGSDPAWEAIAAGETVELAVPYSVTDEHGATSQGVLTLTLTGRNDAPIAQADVASVIEDGWVLGSVAYNDLDVDHGAILDFALTGTAPAGFAMAPDGSWTLDTSGPEWQSLAEGETGDLVVPYSITDQYGAASVSFLTVTVEGLNDAPVAGADFAGAHEDNWAAGSVASNDGDVDNGALLSFVPSGTPPAGFAMESDGSWTFDASGPEWQALGEGETAALVVPYSVIDEHGASSDASLTLTITGGNDGPVARDDAAQVAEDGFATGSVADNDTDPDANGTLSFAPTGSPLPGFFMESDGSWTLDASDPKYQALGAGETHQVALQYRVTDEHGATSDAVLLIAVTGANDAPVVLTTRQDGFMQEDGPSVTGQIGFDDADWLDVHGASVVRLGTGPALGSIAIDGFESHYGSTARILDWHYTPGPGLQSLEEGELAIEQYAITISDGHGGTVTQVVTVAIRGSGDAPVATPASTIVLEDTILSGALSLFASDVDHGSVLSFATATPPAGFTLAPNGDWTFDARHAAYQQLNAGQTMTVVVPYTVVDPTGRTGSSMLTIIVHGANETIVTAPPPVFTGAGDPNDFDSLVGPGAPNNAATITASPAGGTITGGAAAQTITGSDSADTIYGGGGNDVINGRGNGDRLYGQAGADTLDASWGTDILYGGSGNDILRGQTPQAEGQFGTWPITFYGGSGSDTIIGGGNNDVLVGGYGADTMTGGGNIDTFVFNSALDTGDRITDFLYGVDKLDLRGIDANPGLAGDQAFLWSHGVAAANSLWAFRQGADTVIFGDTDGNLNTAEFMLTLQNMFFIEPIGSPTGFML